MARQYSKTELLTILRREINKEYMVFDGFGRRSKTLRAPSWAVDGSPCLVVEYLYYGSTEFVLGRKEGYTVWSSSYDPVINQDFLVDDLGDQLQDNLGNDLVG